jgi:hypothetical protein
MDTTKQDYFKTLDKLDLIYSQIGVTERYKYVLRKILKYCYDECTCELEVLIIQEYLDEILKQIRIENNKAYIEDQFVMGGVSFMKLFESIPQFKKAGEYFNFKFELHKEELPKRVLEPQSDWKPLFNTCSVCNINHRWIDTGYCEECKKVTA